MCSKIIGDQCLIIFYRFLILRAMYFVFNKSHILVRLNLVANLIYVMYLNNTLPLALAVHEITRHFWASYGITQLNTCLFQGKQNISGHN